MAASSSDPANLLQQLYYHIALPRDVPGHEDSNIHTIESEILERLTQAVKQIIPLAPSEQQSAIDTVRLALTVAKVLNVEGKIDKSTLVRELSNLVNNQTLILYATEQNAALVIYPLADRETDKKQIIFEVFEASAACANVLATKSALQRDFPGQAISVPIDIVSNDRFLDSISTFLEQASIESIKRFAAVTYKASAQLPEIRDTTDPSLISGLFMTILEANGVRYNPTFLRKRVHDNVSFKAAQKPWRRLPFYLILRVAIQRQLYRLFEVPVGRFYYKIIKCVFTANFLDTSLQTLPAESSHFLIQKLGRQLAKLEMNVDGDGGSVTTSSVDAHIFQKLRPRFEKSLSTASEYLNEQWEQHKLKTRRSIRILRGRSLPSELVLRLPNSGHTLNRIAFQKLATVQSQITAPFELINQYETSNAFRDPFEDLSHRHLRLAEIEENLEVQIKAHSRASSDLRPSRDATAPNIVALASCSCLKLAKTIKDYISTVGTTYDDYPLSKSKMLLDLFALWVALDENAVVCFDLLGEYHPGFDASMLDVLQLRSREAFDRLHEVQSYIERRCQGWRGHGSRTIFDSVASDSFAVVYYDNAGKSSQFANLRLVIEADAEVARAAKEKEWKASSLEHEQLMKKIAENTCPYVSEYAADGTSTLVHQKGCLKHKYKWQAKQLSIKIFEHPLPKDENAAKAAVFELACPEAFAAYRDATWQILSSFAYPTVRSVGKVPLLRDYSGLHDHASQQSMQITLGSSTKSHLHCHYAKSSFPVHLHQVCRPCGLRLDYYDCDNNAWVAKTETPSLSRHFPLKLPRDSPYQSLQLSSETWPTSNGIISSQSKCPADLNVHEFVAWQSLLVGSRGRWLTLLRELGSTNINFSTESTWAIVSRLILQAGPTSNETIFRDVHSVLSDRSFCRKLLEQLRYRLETIQCNWREPVQMGLLIMMLKRLIWMTDSIEIQTSAVDLLRMARSITRDWCTMLQSLVTENPKDIITFIIWASVLCKRTFYISKNEIPSLGFEDLQHFIYASIILQDNVIGSFNALPHHLRETLVEDLLFTYQIRHHLRQAIIMNQKAVISALMEVWPMPQDSESFMPSVEFVPNTWWVQVTVTSNPSNHYLQFNVLHGVLLVDGKRSGFLPPEYRQMFMIQQLLGTYNVRVLPSSVPGMALVVDRPMPFKYRIHLGLRDGNVILRAVNQTTMLELVPRTIFAKGASYDLPSALIENCYHWLNLETSVVEIRQGDIWKSKPSHWRLDLRTRCASRRRDKSLLVDSNSDVARTVAQNFYGFEYSNHITILQPQNRNLVVTLDRLELSFFVNTSGLLQCHQLGAEIPTTSFQDPGIWTGLRSKLVIRSVRNPGQRSILVPQGLFVCNRDNDHVSIVINNCGSYLKFDINEVLGRVDSPAEPRLLYTRALLHAYTSYFLPDRLTGRTGLEESLSYLRSGSYLPWTPLQPKEVNILLQIRKLTPHRTYYPPTLKCMESVTWNPNLTSHIQDDRYRAIVERIFGRSSDLSMFTTELVNETPKPCLSSDMHLELRALARTNIPSVSKDDEYQARDHHAISQDRSNVAMVSKLLAEWPSTMSNTKNLRSLLEQFPMIGGFVTSFDRVQIFDQISADLGLEWGALSLSALQSEIEDRYHLMFMLGSVAFSKDANMDLIRVLVALAALPGFKELKYPDWPSYRQFKVGESPTAESLASLMKDAKVPHVPEHSSNRTQYGQLALARLKHQEEAQNSCLALARSVRKQWPTVEIKREELVPISPSLLDTEKALEHVLEEWSRLAQNFELDNYLREVQCLLNQNGVETTPWHTEVYMPGGREPIIQHPQYYPCGTPGLTCPDLRELMKKSVTVQSNLQAKLDSIRYSSQLRSVPVSREKSTQNEFIFNRSSANKAQFDTGITVPQSHISELSDIVSTLRQSASRVHREFGTGMERSIQAFKEVSSQPHSSLPTFNPSTIASLIAKAKADCDEVFSYICDALQAGDKRAKWLQYSGQWPKMTLVSLLAELRSTSNVEFGDNTKELLVLLAVNLTTYQRQLRIEDASFKSKDQQVYDEIANLGHGNWAPLDHIDWLLLQVDNNVLLRDEQVDVARATIQPDSNQNSVLQLLMGKGKTSCVLPMVALALADKQQLLRIIVPRALLLQSAQSLQAKLGGLLDREVMHIPFSRKTPTNCDLIQRYGQLHVHIKNNSGVMLALPEHILSFKLSGLQQLSDNHMEEATAMIELQNSLDKYARDILDESDVSLAIRTQLIYPSGTQSTVDGHPLRWQIVQSLLRLLKSYLPDLEHRFPRSIEVVKRPVGDFPLIYLLRQDVEDHLIAQMAAAISDGQIIPCAEYPKPHRDDIKTFISSSKVSSEVVGRVTTMFKDKLHLMKATHLLRGLLVHRILISTLKKRWNVQYGLHPLRDPIAVPYHAKGVPSPSSEWGHPDVAIILTCLSFYYQGLDLSQFKQAFEQLSKADEPSIEYEKWSIRELPENLRDYNAINVEDASQLRELHQYISHNTFLIEFYLNTFVFPRHAKQFETKLQASGWDLVVYDPGREVNCQTTGFSGTNDSRHQLPMTIKQNDLPNLSHTNAEVLCYLLERRNRSYVQAVGRDKKRLSEYDLLKKLYNPLDVAENKFDPTKSIRILIDAGAQILEHQNKELAKMWLSIDYRASAAIYFDSNHAPWVLYRQGKTIPLVASPFADNMENCLVYLDESHCRGTDLKLPPHARAALTLGPHLTKDALAQAAMRLRLLGTTQSVTFLSPPEVHQSIIDLRHGSQTQRIDSSHVIRWLLEQTCNTIEQMEPLFYTQGINYLQHVQGKLNNSSFLRQPAQRTQFLSMVQSKELHTLEDLYHPKPQRTSADLTVSAFAPSLQPHLTELLRRKGNFQDRGTATHSSALEEVEVEREVEHEVESVRETQLPVHFMPFRIPSLHRDVEFFARTGRFRPNSSGYLPVFIAMQKTNLGSKHTMTGTAASSSDLYVSTQFMRTVKVTTPNDNFLRPCQWILWNSSVGTALVVSPEEADQLLSMLRDQTRPDNGTHLIIYAAPTTRRMLHFNNLDFHATPELPKHSQVSTRIKIELGIFAGRLYFDWGEYDELLQYLGVKVDEDNGVAKVFTEKPLTFLHDWLAILRKGQDFEHTPMGFLTTGKPLFAEHPFFMSTATKEPSSKPKLSTATRQPEHNDSDEEEDDDDHEDEMFHLAEGNENNVQPRIYDEDALDEEGNTFLGTEAYVEPEDDQKEQGALQGL